MPDPVPASPSSTDQALKDASAKLSENLEQLLAQQKAGALEPGAGGWTPPPWFPLAAAGTLALLTAAGTLVTGPITPALVIAAIAAGSSTGLATLLGIKSAGPRKDV